MKQRTKEIIGGIILVLFILTTTVLFVKGFSELIQNQSPYVIVFYAVLAMIGVWKIGDMLRLPLEFIIKKSSNIEKAKGVK